MSTNLMISHGKPMPIEAKIGSENVGKKPYSRFVYYSNVAKTYHSGKGL